MKEKQIYIPTKNAKSWRSLLAHPERQWRAGYSARLVAESWERAKGLPKEILSGLQKAEDTKDAELLLAIPEFKVHLPGGNRASQNDVFAVTRNVKGLTSIAVEAKAREDFDKTLRTWMRNASAGKKTRLTFILEKILFPSDEFGELRYQLFHRMASAVIMAEKYHAKNAMMIIQSFVESDDENHYSDFVQFVSAYGLKCVKNEPILLTQNEHVNLYAMWIYSAHYTSLSKKP